MTHVSQGGVSRPCSLQGVPPRVTAGHQSAGCQPDTTKPRVAANAGQAACDGSFLAGGQCATGRGSAGVALFNLKP
eukprot:365205-Chlamydomonas_euryale.AAC.2